MTMTLRKHARLYSDPMAFIAAFQSCHFGLKSRHGATGCRELARIWARVH